MDYVLRLLFFEVLGLGVIAISVKSFRLRDHWFGQRAPIEGKLLRGPGQSLQSETQNLNDWLMGLLAGIAATPAILLGQMPRTISGGYIGVMAVSVIAWAVPLVYLLGLRRSLELALRGERAVGEELNRLMLDGCHVFHDSPAGSGPNIDHIVVGTSGVYAVKTKTRRKRRSGGKQDNQVKFDGSKLIFPNGWDTSALDQARRNAADLSAELTKATGETVVVKAVMAVPGWSVESSGKSDVTVVSPAQVREVITASGSPSLSPQQIQQISDYLEQKCRDVEL